MEAEGAGAAQKSTTSKTLFACQVAAQDCVFCMLTKFVILYVGEIIRGSSSISGIYILGRSVRGNKYFLEHQGFLMKSNRVS